MSRPALRAWIPWLVSLIAIVIGLALVATTPPERVPVGFRIEDALSYLFMPLASTTVGAVVAWRRPRNPIGWLLAALGWISSWQYLTAGYAVRGLFGDASLPFAELAAWAFSSSGMWEGVVLGDLVLRFPDGRLAEPRGRSIRALFVVAAVFTTAAIAFRPGPLFIFREVANPLGVAGADRVLDAALGAATLLYVASAVYSISALLKRSGQAVGAARQQFKWFLSGVLLASAVAIVGGALLLTGSSLAKFVLGNGFAAIPISIGVAILRYRLYDIDLLINRTVVYGVTSGAIVLTFFVGILALQTLLRPLTAGSELAIAASTLFSFALFQPVRRRVQDAVDSRFDRSRYDAARTLDAFADRLRDEVDLDPLRADLLGAVRSTMSPAHVSLWLRESGR